MVHFSTPRSTPRHTPRHVALALGLLLGLAVFPAAQGEIKAFARTDPYTKSAPEAIEKAGYASFGPFRFGDDHTTDQIATTLGGIPLIWVETEHFKLGSGLPEYTLADDKQEREEIRVELERLAKKLPDVKTKVRKLDPWLRLHLYAQRLEEHYARFLSEFGIREDEFPKTPAEVSRKSVYMGEGVYLGMPAKFTVILFDKKSAVGRYSAAFLGGAREFPFRWHFPMIGSWLFVTAEEFLEGDYQNDMALACEVASGVSQNLACGFRGSRVMLPFAVSEGIAHWFSRQVDPRFHMFTGTDLTKVRLKDEWNWAPSVRARVEHKVFKTTEEMLGWNDADALEWADHLIVWSRVDYLLARDDGAGGTFLRLLKEPSTQKTPFTPEELAARARQALEKATGADLARFDVAWSEWVLEAYPKK